MMKKVVGMFLFAVLVFALTSCGTSTANEWQEQYDLGEQCLQEEDYEAAIEAFTAAAASDSNEPAAYIGRGNAYRMLAETDTQTAEESYGNAAADYETALSLYAEEDDTSEVIEKLGESYLALAEYYEAQGDDDMARTCYEKAYELTGDEEIARKLETTELVMDDEPLVDEDTIAYIAKYTADLYYTDDTAVGTANLYICSEKEAILCVEAAEKGEVFDASILWDMKFNNSEYNNGVYQGWYAEISWNYEDGGVVSEFFYFNYDEDMNGETETADNAWLSASEASVTELDGNVYTQMRFVIPDDDTFEFQVLEGYNTIEGYLSLVGC
ncbi:MAG: hypothetical protein LUE31_05320 [Lachnospiraceae bacterium]|nr:hypothetical protein [Lachnospiraceae bacterium]